MSDQKTLTLRSNGKPNGTEIIDDQTGKPLAGVASVNFYHSASNQPEIEVVLDGHRLEACGVPARFCLTGVGFIRAVELEDGRRIEVPFLHG